MTITEKIDKIIDRRIGRNDYEGAGHLQVIQAKQEFFTGLLPLLNEYQSLRENILYQIDNASGEYYKLSLEDLTFQQKIELADPSAVLKQLQACLKECERMEKRFNRDTINISVVGRARQGKSRLLQSISGLSNEVIPASNGGDCTGAKSVISNQDCKTYAKVTFYSELELVEQVQKYLDALGITRHIGSISQIGILKSEVEAFEQMLSAKSGKIQSLFQHFKKYVLHFDAYASYIGTVIDQVPEECIRNYVAQYDVNMRATYAFLAVKEVCIYTAFPVSDAGRIVLVDTIGLGDTSLGIREKMIQTLRDDSDAAVLVRLPSANGDSIRVEDDELYDLIREAMGTEALNKWLFFALNVCDELGNHNSGIAMENALKGRKLNYAFIKKVNCGDRCDVERELLLPILEYLTKNLSDVDNSLLQHANTLFADAFQKYFDLCSKVGNILNGNFKQAMKAGRLFDGLYQQLHFSHRLKELDDKYNIYSGGNAKCEELQDEIKGILRNIKDACPSREVLIDRLKAGAKGTNPTQIYIDAVDATRAAIIDQFETISQKAIQVLQERLKNEIIAIMRSEDGGLLNRIPLDLEDDADNVGWLAAFISQKLGDFPLLKESLERVLNFKLGIEGALQHYVRMSLRTLDTERPDFKLPSFSMRPEEDADIIRKEILLSMPVIASELMAAIDQHILPIPYESFHTEIRKLRDRLFYNEEYIAEMKELYRDNIAYIWKEEIKAVATKQDALEHLIRLNNQFSEKRAKHLFNIELS